MAQRDPLTGEPLSPHTLHLALKDDGLPGSPPLQLHNRVVCHDGSREFTRPALRAMRDKPIKLADHSYHWNHWWQLDGAERALYSAFPAIMVNIVLLARRDYVDWETAMQGTGCTFADVQPYDRGMALYIRRTFLPDEYANE